MTGKRVNVTTDYREKQLQRALLQFSKPENANLVREALKLAGREDLIGNTPECLVRPAFGQGVRSEYTRNDNRRGHNAGKNVKKPSQRPASPSRGGSTGGKKLGRIFGDDAQRIRREADRLSSASAGKKSRPVGSAKGKTKAKTGKR